ncbi:MAG: polysaccharide lyase family protein [Tepidisphaerales bacterium]
MTSRTARFLAIVLASLPMTTLSAKTLFQIGKPDHSNAEFAQAPADYSNVKQDGLFAIGQSDPKKDWPYVHPGPNDAWAGAKQHSFHILFDLKAVPAEGICKLTIDLLDTQKPTPPRVAVTINGKTFEKQLPPGGGDDSVNGQPAKGKPYAWPIEFPAGLLHKGMNTIAIRTLSGSWMLYDAVTCDAPDGAELGQVSHTAVLSADGPNILTREGDQLTQPATLRVAHFGQPAKATLKVGAVSREVDLQPGVTDTQLNVPAVEKPTAVEVSLAVNGEPLPPQQVTLKPVRKWEVYLLPHSHVDIGYTHIQSDVEKVQCKNIEDAIRIAQKTASYPEGSRYKWNSEVMWPIDVYLRKATPEQRKFMMDAIKAGQLELDALYGNTLTGLCRPEELVQLVEFAQTTGKQAGVNLECAMISDVPGYVWGMVPVLSQAGVKYFSIGPNEGDRIGRTISAHGDKPFYWISPSGKEKVLVWVAGMGYSHFHGGGLTRRSDELWRYLNRLDAQDYPYDIVHVRYNVGGDNGGPDPAVSDFVRDWNEKHAYPRLILATASEMFHAFEKRYGDKVPSLKGDFSPYWEDGAPSTAAETTMNRATADRLVQAEFLWNALNPAAYPAGPIADAWRGVLLYSEHTWGAHNSISQPDAPFVKTQWATKQGFAVGADKVSRQVMADILPKAAGAVTAIDVINTTSWPRTDIVIVSKELAATGNGLRGPNGQPVITQLLPTGEMLFVAENVPPMSSARYAVNAGQPRTVPELVKAAQQFTRQGEFRQAQGVIQQILSVDPENDYAIGVRQLVADQVAISTKLKVDDNTISNAFVAIKVDPSTGDISSFRADGSDHEFVDPKAGSGLNSYTYLIGADPKNAKRNSSAKVSMKASGPIMASLVVESDAPGCNKLTREIRLFAGVRRVDLIDTFDKKPIRQKEGVHVGFALNVPDSQMRWDTAFATVRAEADQLAGACRNWYSVQRFIDVSNDRLGMTIASPDAPLWEMGGLTANVLGSANNPAMWIEKNPQSALLYSWVMNNHWHTNYKADQDGLLTFRFSLQPHAAFASEDAYRFGTEIAQPLLVCPAMDKPLAAPFKLDAAATAVSCIKRSRDGKATIVRLYNPSAKSDTVKLTWTTAPKAVLLSDLTESPLMPAGAAIDVAAGDVVTLRVE